MTEFLVIGLAIAILLLLWKSRRTYRGLPELPAAPSANPPDVTVVIPARNEAHQIARAVQSFPGLPVIVVDDDSSDHTARAAVDAGARVISAPPLPQGVMGKPNACLAGAQQTTTKWILFVDSDTWFEPSLAASMVQYAADNQLQVVSAFLDQHCGTFWEKALLPYAFALYFCGVSARKVNDAGSKEALANGQCLLFERAAYEAIGGHGCVLRSVIEDVALAAEAKRSGLGVRVVRAEKLGHVRMYDSIGAIWRGFEKNSFRFLLMNPASGVQVVIASILLTSWLPVLIFGALDLPVFSIKGLVFSPLIALFLAPFLGLLPWYGRWFWMSPIGIYVFQSIALNGMITAMFRRNTIWKDRRV